MGRRRAADVGGTRSASVAPQALGLAAIGAAILSFSLGSTMVKSIGAPGPIAAFWRLLIGSIVWHLYLAATGRPATREAWRRVAPRGCCSV